MAKMLDSAAVHEIELPSGTSERVTRLGGKVFRPCGRWSPAVHSLLLHLERVGFSGAPRFLGVDDSQREILSFLDGTVGHYPAPAPFWSDAALIQAGRLLRRFHDSTASYRAPANAEWQLAAPADQPLEVICHNDFAPYNCVYRAGLPVAILDFDAASPGSRAWDLAYTAYRFVPLSTPGLRRLLGAPPDLPAGHRLRKLCEAYGLRDRRGFLELIVRRVVELRRFTASVAMGSGANAERVRSEGHLEAYDRDLQFLASNARRLQRHLDARAV